MNDTSYHCEDNGFEEFVKEQLLFRKVIEVREVDDQTAELTLDNGVVLVAEGNEGCGGCGNGWYYLTALNTCDNAITNIEVVEENEEVYSIYVYAEDNRINLLTFEGGDNGYYGVGYTLYVKVKN
jgi:hypothetical protein